MSQEGNKTGKPYFIRVTDEEGKKLSETNITYKPDNNGAPYFNPPQQVDKTIFEGSQAVRHSKTVYTYDDYGNVIEEYHYPDLSDSAFDNTVTRHYSFNTTDWIVGLPDSENVYQGIGTSNKVAGTTYYYDDLSSCTSTPTGNQTPTKGNLTGIERWLDGGVNPVVGMAYNPNGTLKCIKDPKGNPSAITYDSSNTFPVVATNPLGHATTTKYYGVDGETGNGLYGQTKSVTDPNQAVITYEYDKLGRQTLETKTGGFSTQWSYNDFGNASQQYIRTSNSFGLFSNEYFDGFGRTWKAVSSGPDSRNIVSNTHYHVRGAVDYFILPYFGTGGTSGISFTYDALGRVTYASKPGSTGTSACYVGFVTVLIDENGHAKRQTIDPLGRLAKVEEYKGTFLDCTTDLGSPYSTTTYEYNILGNLRFVTAAKDITGKQNVTEMRYDTLGRKTYMNDPDMGEWTYTYDENDNLLTQTDANQQTITFAYNDQLNRLTSKSYPLGTGVTYTYDEAFSTNGLGRLTTMTDESGSTQYFYDKFGRTNKTIKSVTGEGSYTLEATYDALDRVTDIYYPNEHVQYSYNTAGDIYSVYKVGATKAYATFTDYNAVGQPGTITYGNDVTTTLSYSDTTKLLSSIVTSSTKLGGIVNLSYGYDNKGNIKTITDTINNNLPNNFIGDTYYSYAGKAHAVGSTGSGRNFVYDNNGNMTNDGQGSIRYTYDNMPRSIKGLVSFVYDGVGSRVKKISQNAITVYLDKLYECTNGYCDKHIFAGDSRIAVKTETKTFYHHTDHQGSTIAVTDENGDKNESIAYYPFGETRLDDHSVYLNYKYTGQELDSETGLYNYNARLYDPLIGRFISPDSIVSDPTNPQSLNRYSYVINNPLNLTDPSGQDWDDWDSTRYLGLWDGGTMYLAQTFPEQTWSTNFNTYSDPWSNYSMPNNNNIGPPAPSSTSSSSGGGSSFSNDLKSDISTFNTYFGNLFGMSDLQLGLDAVGMTQIPVISNVANLTNAGIYGLQGEKVNAGLSVVSAIPVVGLAGTVGKIGKASTGISGRIIRTKLPSWTKGGGFNPIEHTKNLKIDPSQFSGRLELYKRASPAEFMGDHRFG